MNPQIKFLKNPLDNPVVSCGFGKRVHPIEKRPDFHNGLDFKASINVPIKAVNDGYVLISTQHVKLGWYMVIVHVGFCTMYAHLSRRGLPVGQQIKAGDTIGYVGSTGESTGPHLHFEVREGGYRSDKYFWDRIDGKYQNSVDPAPYLMKQDEIEELVSKAAPALKLNNESYWVDVIKGIKQPKPEYIKQLFINVSK